MPQLPGLSFLPPLSPHTDRIDEEDFGGHAALVQEGMGPAASLFMVGYRASIAGYAPTWLPVNVGPGRRRRGVMMH
jgi:hypothetical protein